MPRKVLISAGHKSSGKTIFSIGLLAALKKRGIEIQAFKKGPDYIDPRWLALASGKDCYNLDYNTQETNELYDFFYARRGQALAVIEGNKGLYDDVAEDTNTSSAALSSLLQAPIILVLDCMGVSTGIAPLLLGYIHFKNNINIAAVVLNRVGGARHEAKLLNAIDRYVGIRVLGTIGRDTRIALPERHLGLIPSKEALAAQAFVVQMGQVVEENVDCDALLEIARADKELPRPDWIQPQQETLATSRQRSTRQEKTGLRLGVFFDRAFHFYYPDDLESFTEQGVELVYIDSLEDTALPQGLDGLFIGGGFPETQAAALERNERLRMDVKAAIESGLPGYAECGGMMYLTRSIEWDGKKYAMAGVIQADAVMHQTPQGRGYVKVYEEAATMPWDSLPENEANVLSGHEFHYCRLEGVSHQLPMAFSVLLGGEGIVEGRDGIVYKNLLATFLHQRATRSNLWTKRFVEFMHKHKQENRAHK